MLSFHLLEKKVSSYLNVQENYTKVHKEILPLLLIFVIIISRIELLTSLRRYKMYNCKIKISFFKPRDAEC